MHNNTLKYQNQSFKQIEIVNMLYREFLMYA